MESNEDCQQVIAARVAEGHFPKDTPTFGDVTKFSLSDLQTTETVDGFVGGFPCQARPLYMLNEHPLFFFAV